MTLHPDAGRNDHIHGDEHLSEFEEFNVTVTVIKKIVINILAKDSIDALECVKENMGYELYVSEIDDAEIIDTKYEVSE